jgi:hypothetical protein
MVAAQQAPTADRPLPPLPEPVRTASEVSLPRVAPSRRLSAPFHLCSPPPLLRWPFGCFGVARHLAAGVGGEARTRATGGMANTRAAIQPAEASPWSMAWRMLKATEAALNSTTSAHRSQVGRLARVAATTVRVGQDGRGDDGGRGSRCGRPCPPWPAPDAGAVVHHALLRGSWLRLAVDVYRDCLLSDRLPPIRSRGLGWVTFVRPVVRGVGQRERR